MNTRPRIHSTLLLGALTLAALVTAAPAPAAAENLRKTLFTAADRALERADAARAALLAPHNYAEGADRYRRAEDILSSGGDIDDIQRHLAKAQSAFARAAGAANAAGQAFAATLEARADAQNAESADYAAKLWRSAEEDLDDAARALERGRERRAERQAARAEERYREAELQAIQANYLTGTRTLLEQADDLRARRYAPISYGRAQESLAAAEQALIQDRYDTDRPRNLARLAEHNARHAIYVSRLERAIRDDDTTLEQVLLQWESSIAGLADELDMPVFFDEGEQEALASMGQAVARLKDDLSFLEQGVADRDARIASLELELGGQSESLERVNQTLAARERQRERFDRVESLFDPDQGVVLRKADSLILRLVGLSFPSGSARLQPDHERILGTVQEALGQFPGASVVIEGHTDAFGADASNQSLSRARAEAVLQYLLANSPLSPAQLTALGYGESRPVANNETAEGRRRNRRIDIVIYPRGSG